MDGYLNAQDRLAEFERDYNNDLEQDTITPLTEDEKRLAALFAQKLRDNE